MLRSIASTSARQFTAVARPQPFVILISPRSLPLSLTPAHPRLSCTDPEPLHSTARFISSSLRTSFPAQGSVSPTTSEASAGTDRGGSLPSDAQEGAQADAKGLKKDEQSTNTSASSAANAQKGTGASANKDGISGGGNPLKPGAAKRSYHTSAVLRKASPAAEQPASAQHTKNTKIDHLAETVSASEEAVHADRLAEDPLSKTAKASSAVEGAAGKVQETASLLGGQTAELAGKAAGAVKSAASTVKETIAKATGTKAFSTSAVASKEPSSQQEVSGQHNKNDHIEHLGETVSSSEEAVHAEKHAHDPLPDSKKASKGEKEKKCAFPFLSSRRFLLADYLPFSLLQAEVNA